MLWKAVFKHLTCRKAQRGVSGFQGLLVGGLFFAFGYTACGQSFSEGKNLLQLEKAVFPAMHTMNATAPFFIEMNNVRTIPTPAKLVRVPLPNPQSQIQNPRLMPRWSAETLPFFCRIEHDFAQKSAVPFKFRLVSVEYVDWLAGKVNAGGN